jgi:hypothetical protein
VSVEEALTKLLAAGGFAVFDLGDDAEYVQFSREQGHISLMWPSMVPKMDAAQQLAQQLGARTERADDGLYADFGRDVDAAAQFVDRAFQEIFERTVFHINIRQETE